MANFIRNVLVDGVTYAVGDKRIEGDQFAYIQIPEVVTVGTNLTDLAPIQKALDSTDGAMLYVPSLNALFSPTASSDPTIRIWSSTVGDKGYQLKATLNASGALQSAVVNEASAEAGLIITDAEWTPVFTQYRGKNPAHFDPTGTYLITDEAKAIANKLISINMAEGIIESPDKFQIEIKAMLSSFANCVFNDFSMTDMAATFKVLGNVPYIHPMSGNVESLDLDIIGPKLKNNGTIAGLIIKEPQPSEDDIIIEYTDVATLQSATTDPYTPVTTAAAKEIGEKIFNNPRKRIFVHYDNSGENFYQELKPTAPFPVNFESGGNLAYIFADLSEDGYNMCIRVFVGPVDIIGATACPHYMTVSEYALICDNSETTSDPFLTDDVSIWIGKSLGTNCFGLSAAGGTDKVFYKRIVDKADFTGTGATSYDTFTYELDRKFTSPGSGKNYTSSKNINVYYNDSLEVVGILVVDPPKNESVAFNISTDDYEDIKYDTENLTTDPYVTADLAKSIGKKLLGHFKNPEVGFDIDHFTVSNVPTSNAFTSVPISFYTYTDHEQFDDNIATIKFTTTAEIYNGDITVFYNKSDSTAALGMRIDPKPEEFVRISKKYMEVEVDPAPIQVMQKEITVSDGDTLNINSVLISIDVPDKEIIHYPSSVILKGDDEFALEFKIGWNTTWASGWYGTNYDGSTTYLEYSYDGKTWVNIPKEVAMTPIQSKYNDELNGHVIFIRGNSSMYTKDMDICKAFITSTDATYVDILGDIAGICPEPGYNALQQFFANNALIRDCSGLKMHTNLGYDSGAYIQMFLGCVNLIKPPVLPATELCASAYDQMFGGCTSLTSAPVLPATILGAACYGQMFKECTALVNAPVLIAKNIPQNAYTNMFEGCTALVIPPVILAESVDSNGCYEMFKDCTSLKRCPDLNFTTLSGEYCCAYMFGGCTLLTRPANLYPTTIVKGAYNYMYDGCTNIKWATTGEPYRIPCIGEGTATVPSNYAEFMFSADDPSDPLPEGTGTPKLNTTYYLAV